VRLTLESCGIYVGGQKARPDEGCVSLPADTTGVTFRRGPLTISGDSEEQRIEFAAAPPSAGREIVVSWIAQM